MESQLEYINHHTLKNHEFILNDVGRTKAIPRVDQKIDKMNWAIKVTPWRWDEPASASIFIEHGTQRNDNDSAFRLVSMWNSYQRHIGGSTKGIGSASFGGDGCLTPIYLSAKSSISPCEEELKQELGSYFQVMKWHNRMLIPNIKKNRVIRGSCHAMKVLGRVVASHWTVLLFPFLLLFPWWHDQNRSG